MLPHTSSMSTNYLIQIADFLFIVLLFTKYAKLLGIIFFNGHLNFRISQMARIKQEQIQLRSLKITFLIFVLLCLDFVLYLLDYFFPFCEITMIIVT